MKVCRAWAVEFIGSPGDDFRRFLRGVPNHPCRTLLFDTREKAREWLATMKRESAWAFEGGWAWTHQGNRIYADARVVRVSITIAELDAREAKP